MKFCPSLSRLPIDGRRGPPDLLAICNHACPCDVSCDRSLTCNCVKGAALSICNARPHQCLMHSPPRSFISLPPSLHPSVYESRLPFGIDPPLAANEKELRFLGLEAGGPSGFWGFATFFLFWTCAVQPVRRFDRVVHQAACTVHGNILQRSDNTAPSVHLSPATPGSHKLWFSTR